MHWKNTGLFAIILAAFAIVAYAQSGTPQRAHSTNLQMAMDPGYLGVGVQELSPEQIKSLSLKEHYGVEVKAVVIGSPAAKIGLRLGDVILEVNGQKVEGTEHFQDLIGGKPPGAKVTLTVFRNDSREKIVATLEARPQGITLPGIGISPDALRELLAGNAPRIGFEGEPLTSQLADFFGVTQGEGVLVRSVAEKTAADRAGLKAGDVVIKVNGIPVSRFGEITGIVLQTKKATFTVIRNKKIITLNVEMARNRNPFGYEDPVNN
jgi:serine protease Do